MAFILWGSSRSLDSASIESCTTSDLFVALLNLISSSVTASSLNNNLDGVKLVAMEMELLWLYTVFDNSSSHFSFFWSSSHFWILVCLPVLPPRRTGCGKLRRRLLRCPSDSRNCSIDHSQTILHCRLLSLLVLQIDILCFARKIYWVMRRLCWLDTSPLSILWSTQRQLPRSCNFPRQWAMVPLC
jgi:hypothetical protein